MRVRVRCTLKVSVWIWERAKGARIRVSGNVRLMIRDKVSVKLKIIVRVKCRMGDSELVYV